MASSACSVAARQWKFPSSWTVVHARIYPKSSNELSNVSFLLTLTKTSEYRPSDISCSPYFFTSAVETIRLTISLWNHCSTSTSNASRSLIRFSLAGDCSRLILNLRCQPATKWSWTRSRASPYLSARKRTRSWISFAPSSRNWDSISYQSLSLS